MLDTFEAGFCPENAGNENAAVLQKLIDKSGDIRIVEPGVYDVEGTIKIGSDTSLIFGANVYIRRVTTDNQKLLPLFINKGAYTRSYDSHIKIEGLNIICNNVDVRDEEIPGLRGQVAFYYVKDLIIRDFRCMDLLARAFCIQICSFEKVLLENISIEGKKDALHFGCGKNFTVRHGFFKTFDDPIALNGHDYSSSNPEYGWIENGLIEDCYDLNQEHTTGFFCRILAGAWGDWQEGMQVQNSDLVVSDGKVYSVYMNPDGETFVSSTPPTHTVGIVELDGIRWRLVTDKPVYDAGCRNIHFKDIHLQKKRERAFSLQFDNDRYSRSVYPTATMSIQENIILENIYFENEIKQLVESVTPCDCLKIINSVIDNSTISLRSLPYKTEEYPEMKVLFSGNTFKGDGGCIVDCDNGRSAAIKIVGSVLDDETTEFYTNGDVRIISSDIDIVQDN
jgi:hypothetical protein